MKVRIFLILFVFLTACSTTKQRFIVDEKVVIYIVHGMKVGATSCHVDMSRPLATIWINDQHGDPVPDVVGCIHSTSYFENRIEEFVFNVDACMEKRGWTKAEAYAR